jgi:hypothetical protein
MKKQNKRLLDPLVGRARHPKQSGPVAGQPPVGRETAALKQAIEKEFAEARAQARQYDVLDGRRKWMWGYLSALDWVKKKLRSTLKAPRAANAKLSDAGGEP